MPCSCHVAWCWRRVLFHSQVAPTLAYCEAATWHTARWFCGIPGGGYVVFCVAATSVLRGGYLAYCQRAGFVTYHVAYLKWLRGIMRGGYVAYWLAGTWRTANGFLRHTAWWVCTGSIMRGGYVPYCLAVTWHTTWRLRGVMCGDYVA
jgi:hypothetical protein